MTNPPVKWDTLERFGMNAYKGRPKGKVFLHIGGNKSVGTQLTKLQSLTTSFTQNVGNHMRGSQIHT